MKRKIVKAERCFLKVSSQKAWGILRSWSLGCTKAYNFALTETLRVLEANRNGEKLGYPSYYMLNRFLTGFKADNPEMYGVPSHALQHAVKDLATAVSNYFIAKSEGDPDAKMPTHKPEHANHCVFLPACRFKIECDEGRWNLVLRHEGRPFRVRFFPNDDFNPDDVTSVRLTRPKVKVGKPVRCDAPLRAKKKWFVSLTHTYEKELDQEALPDLTVGIDRNAGLGNTIVVSNEDGEVQKRYVLPDSIDRLQDQIEKLQKKKDAIVEANGKNYKTRRVRALNMRIAKKHSKIANIRDDFINHVSKELSLMGRRLVLEDLDIKGMTKSAKGTEDKPGKNVKSKSELNRKILASGWGKLGDQVISKGWQEGADVYECPPEFTSQLCATPSCAKKGVMGIRCGKKFYCPECDVVRDADLNGSMNIARIGVDPRYRIKGQTRPTRRDKKKMEEAALQKEDS
ncbi:MAG: hypothetical protein DRQ14_08060 [Candidatus Latescibacterota bacterium]|nr:MAG: hypothetical protein DRQ14_08060 [Candidatus Latescibacterota bacterium]